MTSINAIRFDDYSGAMVCDEQRHWNDERIKIYAADKIRPIIPAYVRERYGLAASYGNTGTSAIGDELRLTIYRVIENLYQEKCRELGTEPEKFLSVREVARIAWDVICKMKHTHVNDALIHRYGFTTPELIQGKYMSNGQTFEIGNKSVVSGAMEQVARDPNRMGSDAVFGNGGIVAGYDQENGYELYNFSMKEGWMEKVECGYVALGSGGDTTNFVLPRYFNTTGVDGRISGIDRARGIYSVIDAVNMAAEHNLGVGGYWNIILFDGKQTGPNGLYCEINDHRVKLASEVVRANRAGYLPSNPCYAILNGLLFQQKDQNWAESEMWKNSSNPLEMNRMLRGYPLSE